MRLEDKLISFRKTAGYTQQEIADLIGVERSTYAGYETGKATIPMRKIQLLAIIYNLDLNAFNTTDCLVLHAPKPVPEGVETDSPEENDNRLTKEERMLLAKMRLIRAMGKADQLAQALEQLADTEDQQ